jgi:WD40 repeat protein
VQRFRHRARLQNLEVHAEHAQERGQAAGESIRQEQVAFTPDGSFIAAGESGRELLGIATADTFEPVTSAYLSGDMHCMVFSPDGSMLAVGVSTSSGDGAVMLFDTNVIDYDWLEELNTFNEPSGEVRALALRPDGSVLAAGVSPANPNDDGNGIVMLWDTATFEQIAVINVGDSSPGFLALVDNEHLVIETGTLGVWAD